MFRHFKLNTNPATKFHELAKHAIVLRLATTCFFSCTPAQQKVEIALSARQKTPLRAGTGKDSIKSRISQSYFYAIFQGFWSENKVTSPWQRQSNQSIVCFYPPFSIKLSPLPLNYARCEARSGRAAEHLLGECHPAVRCGQWVTFILPPAHLCPSCYRKTCGYLVILREYGDIAGFANVRKLWFDVV